MMSTVAANIFRREATHFDVKIGEAATGKHALQLRLESATTSVSSVNLILHLRHPCEEAGIFGRACGGEMWR